MAGEMKRVLFQSRRLDKMFGYIRSMVRHVWTSLFILQTSLFSFESTPDVVRLAQHALPAVVYIAVECSPFDQYHGSSSYYEPFRSFYEYFWPTHWCFGSGFIVSPEGYVVTNAHVVEDTTKLLVVLQPTSAEIKVCKAVVLGSDWRTDVAVLKIEHKDLNALHFLEFGDSNQLQIGEPVIVIGNPKGLESTVTMGIVSAIDRNHCGEPIEGFIQTDAPINPGNSGGLSSTAKVK